MAIKALVPESFTTLAFLGPELANQSKLQMIDATADAIMARTVLSPAPTTPAEATARNTRAIGVIGSMGGGAHQVDMLQMRADPLSATSQADKDRANDTLDTLAKSAFIVMQYGGDPTLMGALNTPADVDAVLPPAMQGLGERILANIITNPQIMAELKGLDNANAAANKMGPAGDRFMLVRANASLERLINMSVPPADEDEHIMAMAYIGTVAGELNDIVNPPVVAAGGGASGLEGLFSGETLAPQGYADYIGAIAKEGAFRISPEQYPMWYRHPDLVTKNPDYAEPGGIDRWQRIIDISNATSNWLFKKFKESERWMGELSKLMDSPDLKSITGRDLTLLFNESEGFRQASRIMFRHLFVRDTSFPDPDVFSVRLKIDGVDDGDPDAAHVADWINDFPLFMRDQVVPELVAMGFEEHEAMMYACAARLFIDVTTIDKADSTRIYNGESLDPLRSKYNLKEKMEQKGVRGASSKDQQFGGVIGEYLRRMADLDPGFAQLLVDAEAAGEFLYAPKHTAPSWGEMYPVQIPGAGGGAPVEMSVAQFLLTSDADQVLKFGKKGKDGAFDGYQRDIAPVVDFFGDLFKGKLKVDLRKPDDLKKFVTELSNQRTEMLKVGIPGGNHAIMRQIFDNERFIAMCIVSAFQGEIPLDREVLLPVADDQYNDTVDAILKAMSGVEQKIRIEERVLEKVRGVLHAEQPGVGKTLWREATTTFWERKTIRNRAAKNATRARQLGIFA